jgi:broad specificity phosphatase PhoE
MVQILLVRAGCTDFDDQGRIKGTLDIPLNEAGQGQAAQLVGELHDVEITQVYASPCRSAEQTAELLAADHKIKAKMLVELQNLDHGLWHGKLIDEVRTSQPKVFRQLQDHPETVCPPQGESVGAALERVREWTRARFKLPDDAAILVAEVVCVLPGCPPLETVVAFWTGNDTRHHFKLLIPVTQHRETAALPQK